MFKFQSIKTVYIDNQLQKKQILQTLFQEKTDIFHENILSCLEYKCSKYKMPKEVLLKNLFLAQILDFNIVEQVRMF